MLNDFASNHIEKVGAFKVLKDISLSRLCYYMMTKRISSVFLRQNLKQNVQRANKDEVIGES